MQIIKQKRVEAGAKEEKIERKSASKAFSFFNTFLEKIKQIELKKNKNAGFKKEKAAN